MTIYKYYINPKIDPENRNGLSLEDLHPLYAFTNDKQLAKRFERERKMSLYYKVKTKDVESREWRDYANQHANQVLRYYDYMTMSGYDEEGKPNLESVTILCTFDEREIVDSFCESEFTESIFNDNCISVAPFIFNKKFLRALIVLQYPLFWKMSPYYRDNLVPRNILEEHEYEWEDMVPEYDVDEVAAFLTIYGDNLSENFGLSTDIATDEDFDSSDF